jgi:hypothetical protein
MKQRTVRKGEGRGRGGGGRGRRRGEEDNSLVDDRRCVRETELRLDGLAAAEVGEGAMGVREPEEAEQTDHENLADDGEAVDEKGRYPADDGGFN